MLRLVCLSRRCYEPFLLPVENIHIINEFVKGNFAMSPEIKAVMKRLDRLERKIDLVTGGNRLREKRWNVEDVCKFLKISRNHCYRIALDLGGVKTSKHKKSEWRFNPLVVEKFNRNGSEL